MANDTKHAHKTTTRTDNFAGSAPSTTVFDTAEDAFWRNQFEREGYFVTGMVYEDYEPAYRFGYESHQRYTGRKFDDVEHDMRNEWNMVKAKSRLAWEHAKDAVRAAWDRMERKVHDKTHTKHH